MTISDVLNETYIVEETAQIILKKNWMGDIIMFGAVNGKKGEKPVPFSELQKGLKDKFLKAIQKNHDDVTSVEEYVSQQNKPVKFAMLGDRLRLVDDGKSRRPRSLSDTELRAKYGKA